MSLPCRVSLIRWPSRACAITSEKLVRATATGMGRLLLLCRMSCFDRANDVPPKGGDLGYGPRPATRQDATPGQNGARKRRGVTYEEPRTPNHGSGTQVALPTLTVGF